MTLRGKTKTNFRNTQQFLLYLEASISSEIVLVNKAQNEVEETLCAESSRCPQSPVLAQNLPLVAKNL